MVTGLLFGRVTCLTRNVWTLVSTWESSKNLRLKLPMWTHVGPTFPVWLARSNRPGEHDLDHVDPCFSESSQNFSKKNWWCHSIEQRTPWIFLYILQEYLSYFSGKFGKWKNRFEFTFAVDPHIASHSYTRRWPMQYGELLTIMRFNSCLFDAWTQHYVQ